MGKTTADFKKTKWHGYDLFTCEHCKFDVLDNRAVMSAHLYQVHGLVGKKKERAIVPAVEQVEQKDGE